MSERNAPRFIQIDDINDTAAFDAAMAEMNRRIREQAARDRDERPIPKEVFISSVWQDEPEIEIKGPWHIDVDDINDTAAVEAAMEEMWKYIPHKSHSVTRTNVS